MTNTPTTFAESLKMISEDLSSCGGALGELMNGDDGRGGTLGHDNSPTYLLAQNVFSINSSVLDLIEVVKSLVAATGYSLSAVPESPSDGEDTEG